MMYRFLTAAAFSLCLGISGSGAYAGGIDPGLQDVLDEAEPNDVVSTLVYLWDQGEIDQLADQLRIERADRATRHTEVVKRLRSTAELTQQNLEQHLAALHAQGRVEKFEAFWIANVIRVDATPAVIARIAQHPDVMSVYYNLPIRGLLPVEDERPADHGQNEGGGEPPATAGSNPEPGVDAVRAPEVWNDLGYTGEGVLVATLDTGADGDHPALASRWRGLDPAYEGNPEWAWFDPVTETTFPEEFHWSSHGTHTMGSVVGGAPGDAVGVAPGAQWIHAAVIDRVNISTTVADAIATYQWMVAPTGNPEDTWAVPHVCSNSWGLLSSHGYPACDETFWEFIDNTEAAGTVQLFSAGNEGTSGLRRPADRATDEYRNLAVAAIDPHSPSWPLASFSSQGPTFCTLDGSEATKPDIAAPGVNTRSSISGGGYGQKSGTSMASPHVNGVVALMFEACPNLEVEVVKQIIYDTAVDLGPDGKDNQFGYGMIDAYEAVLAAEAACGLSIELASDPPMSYEEGQPETIEVEINDFQDEVVPGSELVFYRLSEDESFTSEALTHVDGNLYQAVIPAPECGDTPEFYVQVESTEGMTLTIPENAPDETYTGYVGELVDQVAYSHSFGLFLPGAWSASGLWKTSNQCGTEGDCAGTLRAYYGLSSGCNYDTGGEPSSGELISSGINVPEAAPGVTVTARFCYTLETDPDSADSATFSIVGGPSVQLPESENWTTYTMDITDFAGDTVQFSWLFETLNGSSEYRGWQIDNVVVEANGIACGDPPPSCHGDVTSTGEINVDDLLAVLNSWGSCEGCPADLTGDGTVDVDDMLIVLNNWGPCDE